MFDNNSCGKKGFGCGLIALCASAIMAFGLQYAVQVYKQNPTKVLAIGVAEMIVNADYGRFDFSVMVKDSDPEMLNQLSLLMQTWCQEMKVKPTECNINYETMYGCNAEQTKTVRYTFSSDDVKYIEQLHANLGKLIFTHPLLKNSMLSSPYYKVQKISQYKQMLLPAALKDAHDCMDKMLNGKYTVQSYSYIKQGVITFDEHDINIVRPIKMKVAIDANCVLK